MRKFALLACAVVLLTAQAPSNPVMAHYRAYSAALERGDLQAAETEAERALEASVSRDGNGGRTGVLAINLAKVRLHNGNAAGAYSPALQAFTIASGDPSAGVDPILASLVLGRAELTEQRDDAGLERLLGALEQATTHPEIGGDAYEAAVQLAQWSAPREDFGFVPGREGDVNTTALAWAYAGRFAAYSSGDHDLALAEALLAEGASRVNAFRRNPSKINERERAAEALTQAAQILAPLAAQRSGTELTVAQRDYGYVLAWSVWAGAAFSNPRSFPFAFGSDENPNTPGVTYCETRLIAQPEPNYPQHAASIERDGIVVVRVLLDNNGASDVRAAAAIPGHWFADAVSEVAPRWRVELADNATSGCEMPSIRYAFVRFMLRY